MLAPKSRNAVLATLYSVIAGLCLSACSGGGGADKKMGMMFGPASVRIETVTLSPFKEKSEYIGTLKSRKSVTLSPHVEGHITQIFVSAGQTVKTGEKIMQIDSRQQAAQTHSYEAAAESVMSDLANAKASLASLQSSLQSKLSNVEFTRAQHQRYQNLAGQGAVAQSELDSWKNHYTAAQADRDAILQQIEGQKMLIQKFERQHKQAQSSLQAQQEQLRYYEIVAPFAGMIGDIPVKLGDHVEKTVALTTLTENHPLEVYVAVPAEKASQIHKGMNVALLGSEGTDYGQSRVSFIAPTVDPASQTVLVKTLFDNSKNELRADQTVRALIVWKEKPVISVPTAAVTQAAGKHFVFVAERGNLPPSGERVASHVAAHAAPQSAEGLVAHQREIEIYGIEGGLFQVKSGLKNGDRIITTGIQRLMDGAPIVEKTEPEFKASGKPVAGPGR